MTNQTARLSKKGLSFNQKTINILSNGCKLVVRIKGAESVACHSSYLKFWTKIQRGVSKPILRVKLMTFYFFSEIKMVDCVSAHVCVDVMASLTQSPLL